MPVPQEEEKQLVQNGEKLTLIGKTYPFKSLTPCDLRNFTRRYIHSVRTIRRIIE